MGVGGGGGRTQKMGVNLAPVVPMWPSIQSFKIEGTLAQNSSQLHLIVGACMECTQQVRFAPIKLFLVSTLSRWVGHGPCGRPFGSTPVTGYCNLKLSARIICYLDTEICFTQPQFGVKKILNSNIFGDRYFLLKVFSPKIMPDL